MRFILLFALFSGLFQVSQASTDSLIIKGRILNLNGRLYRQASFINFSRNNILQPQSELSKQAPLEPDGSFRVSLPMIFTQEEIYLDYGGKAFTTFLGSPGTVEITFNGDSLNTTGKLFYFAGVNADANNQYPLYIQEENKRLSANKALGSEFFKSFWERSAAQARSLAEQRAALRTGAVQAASLNSVPSPALLQWVKSNAEEEQMQILFEHSLSNLYEISDALKDSLNRLAKPPLTGQRVIWASRFGDYADLLVQQQRINSPTRTNSLPVRLMATLIRTYSNTLTPDDKQRLEQITLNGVAEKAQLDFLNKLFAKNETTLNILFNYERESRSYNDLFDSTATEFLNARYLSRNLYKFTYKQQLLLNRHIQSRNGIPQFRQSLDELVRLEVKDSADISKLANFKNARTLPTEALPGYYLTASNDRGNTWVNQILDSYKGSTIYLVKWSMEDAKSREELGFIPMLQSRLPENVKFLFVHLPGQEYGFSDELLRQYLVRHQLKGTHVFLSDNQAMDLLFRLNPLDAGTFAIIRPNGKFALKNAPAPSALDKTVKAILDANK
ncbi:hypothetical protein [Dyadobacter sp. Leaf189]|uniref:hypothetical protein n=1 Tax=Dyadobacter sp. Leaf189 TaxID=1736295 RepID=UPI000AB26B81|nr:hypothetical protein [Dyadobacter sp. Leaf189]